MEPECFSPCSQEITNDLSSEADESNARPQSLFSQYVFDIIFPRVYCPEIVSCLQVSRLKFSTHFLFSVCVLHSQHIVT
jgi:hypothetical protein